ncbi:hypothetical protein HDU97_001334 [Phlyctochytrium planicorne]|nr:hypothetical protein HDU97_001334 [Phlyctochytrium planicorne]
MTGFNWTSITVATMAILLISAYTTTSTQAAAITLGPIITPLPVPNCYPQTLNNILTKEPANDPAALYQDPANIYLFSTDGQLAIGSVCPAYRCLARKSGDSKIYLADCSSLTNPNAPPSSYNFNWRFYRVTKVMYAICAPHTSIVNPEFNCIVGNTLQLFLAQLKTNNLGLTARDFEVQLEASGNGYNLKYLNPDQISGFNFCVKASALAGAAEPKSQSAASGCSRFEIYHG